LNQNKTINFIGTPIHYKYRFSYRNKRRMSLLEWNKSPMQFKFLNINYTFSSSLKWVSRNIKGHKMFVNYSFNWGAIDLFEINSPYSIYFSEIL
jgi:hypothetical protein